MCLHDDELPWSSCRHMLPYPCHSLRCKNLQPCNMHQELTPRAMLLQSRWDPQSLTVSDSDKLPKRRLDVSQTMPPASHNTPEMKSDAHIPDVIKFLVSLQGFSETSREVPPLRISYVHLITTPSSQRAPLYDRLGKHTERQNIRQNNDAVYHQRTQWTSGWCQNWSIKTS